MSLEKTILQGHISFSSSRTLCSHFSFYCVKNCIDVVLLYCSLVFRSFYCGYFLYRPQDAQNIIGCLSYIEDASQIDRFPSLLFHIYCTFYLTLHILVVLECHINLEFFNVAYFSSFLLCVMKYYRIPIILQVIICCHFLKLLHIMGPPQICCLCNLIYLYVFPNDQLPYVTSLHNFVIIH